MGSNAVKISTISYVLSIGVTAALLPACGGSQPPIQDPGVAPQGSAARADARLDSSKAVIYVANYYLDRKGGAVWMYRETTGKKVGRITDQVNAPYGVYVGQNGTLYVANRFTNAVTAYPRGSRSPSSTWSQDLDSPVNLIVDSKGDLFVSNSGNGTVVEYLSGSTAAHEVLQTAGIDAEGIDFDTQGDLYVVYTTGSCSTCGSIEEFAAGSTHGKDLGMVLDEPEGLIVDNSGNILVVESGANRLDLFPPGATKPSRELSGVTGQFLKELAIDANENELYVSSSSQILRSAYPFPKNGGLGTWYVLAYYVQGIALSNGQTF